MKGMNCMKKRISIILATLLSVSVLFRETLNNYSDRSYQNMV